VGRRNPLAHHAEARRGSGVITVRRLLFFIIFVSGTSAILNEWRLEQHRPRVPLPEQGFTVRTTTKHYGVGPVEYIYISRADSWIRIGLWLLGAACLVGGYSWDRRRR
jgi:hypothetical protein